MLMNVFAIKSSPFSGKMKRGARLRKSAYHMKTQHKMIVMHLLVCLSRSILEFFWLSQLFVSALAVFSTKKAQTIDNVFVTASCSVFNHEYFYDNPFFLRLYANHLRNCILKSETNLIGHEKINVCSSACFASIYKRSSPKATRWRAQY